MTSPLPPSLPPALSALPPSTEPPAGAGPSFPSSSAALAAAVLGSVPPTATPATTSLAPLLAALHTQLASSVQLSPQAQQAVRLEAFQQLIAQLLHSIQPTTVQQPSSWPVHGVSSAMHTLLSELLQQATAQQPLPQQLVRAQAWPQRLVHAVLAAPSAPDTSPSRPQSHAPSLPLPTATPTPRSEPPSVVGAQPPPQRLALPVLQTWLVQQGVLQGVDGERPFTLSLRVPVAWAQTQTAMATALHTPNTPPANGAASAPALGLAGLAGASTPATTTLPTVVFSGPVQSLHSSALGVVMQPAVLPDSALQATAQSMRTSALLQLELQPSALAPASAQTAALLAPQLQHAEVQALLQQRGTDPWLLMAQAQADGHPKTPKSHSEQAGLCNRAGCQYQGRAPCAQPFCAEMNYLWSIDRAQRR